LVEYLFIYVTKKNNNIQIVTAVLEKIGRTNIEKPNRRLAKPHWNVLRETMYVIKTTKNHQCEKKTVKKKIKKMYEKIFSNKKKLEKK